MAKCKVCKGKGVIRGNIECPQCEGLGVPLVTEVEEQFDDASEFEGNKLHPDQDGYIDVE